MLLLLLLLLQRGSQQLQQQRIDIPFVRKPANEFDVSSAAVNRFWLRQLRAAAAAAAADAAAADDAVTVGPLAEAAV